MTKTITLIKGDGIGPEISDAVIEILKAADVELQYDVQEAGLNALEKYGNVLPDKVIESIKRNKIALKGPLTTPIGKGFRSVNVQLRNQLDLFASLRPAKSLKNVKTRYKDIDLVVVRENTEDLYAGIERKIDENTCESIKITTRFASERIAKYAFEYAKKNDRAKVTAVTKANICKLTDGLFLDSTRKIASDYPDIIYDEILVDNLCMQLVQNPDKFDTLLLPNMYGDIVSDLTAGLIGGLGVAPGANIGQNYAIFEAVHGSAPDIASQNKANPIALLRSAILMLKYLGEYGKAKKIENALDRTLEQKCSLTPDLGGICTTKEFVKNIISNL